MSTLINSSHLLPTYCVQGTEPSIGQFHRLFPPSAISNLHCSPETPAQTPPLIPLGSDLADFREGP